jgi:hypothetical protein
MSPTTPDVGLMEIEGVAAIALGTVTSSSMDSNTATTIYVAIFFNAFLLMVILPNAFVLD